MTWADHLNTVLREFPDAYIWSLAERRRLDPSEVAEEISEFGVLRVDGFDLPVDVFRKPNEFLPEEFEGVWKESKIMEDNVALPNELHLYVTKINTGLERDADDISFLETLVKAKFRERLPVCDLAEATSMLDRFLDPQVLGFARTNPHADVRELVRKYLHEFEAEGDPFSRDILAEWKD